MDKEINELKIEGNFIDHSGDIIPREEFKAILKELKRNEALIVSDIDIRCAYKLFGRGVFFKKIKIELDGQVYLLGYEGENAYIAEKIGNFLISEEKGKHLEKMIENFTKRKNACVDNKECQELLKAEIDFTNSLIQNGKGSSDSYQYGMYAGYLAEARKEPAEFLKPFNEQSFYQTLQGAASYGYLKFLESELNQIPPSEKFNFKEQYDVVLYFYYSGIYAGLKTHCLKDVHAAEIIAKLADIPGKGNSLRTLFPLATKFDENDKRSLKLFNIDSIERVLAQFEKDQIESPELRLIRDKIQKR